MTFYCVVCVNLSLTKYYVACNVHFIVSLSQNQQMHKIILHTFRQRNFHPQGVFIKELQVLIESRYTIVGFTIQVFTQLTMLMYIVA